jgi:uncharacterized membrane protein affecting hemolysin expression
MRVILRIALSTIFLASFAVLASANQLDESKEQFVEVRAQVVAIGADSKSMVLFDSPNKKMIDVRLDHLTKNERKALIRSDVRRVLVTGRASLVDGRMVIDAQRIEALPKERSTHEPLSTEAL